MSTPTLRGPSLRVIGYRVAQDHGFESVPVVVGLVVAAGALGAAISGLDWSGVADSFLATVEEAIGTAGGSTGGEAGTGTGTGTG